MSISEQGSAFYSRSVLEQKDAIPGIYGNVDFSILPERYISDGKASKRLPARFKRYAERALANPELVEKIRNYTMTGDRVADAYAALIPQHGFRRLVTMLEEVCDKGLEAVPDAPPELVAFIRAMEATPDWVDMVLVEKGARLERIPLAIVAPFIVRGAFIATFLNKYTALPMTMTGTYQGMHSCSGPFVNGQMSMTRR